MRKQGQAAAMLSNFKIDDKCHQVQWEAYYSVPEGIFCCSQCFKQRNSIRRLAAYKKRDWYDWIQHKANVGREEHDRQAIAVRISAVLLVPPYNFCIESTDVSRWDRLTWQRSIDTYQVLDLTKRESAKIHGVDDVVKLTNKAPQERWYEAEHDDLPLCLYNAVEQPQHFSMLNHLVV